MGAWGPNGGQLWPSGRQICPNGARGPPWPLAGQQMRANGHKMGRAHQTKPVCPFAATPGAWGLHNCGPNLKLLRPPGPCPAPGGWPTAIFLGRCTALQKATGTFSTTPGASLGMQFLRALLQNQACSHPGGVACQEPPPPGAPTPPLGWGAGPLAAGGGLKKIRGVCCHPGGLGWPAQSPGRPRTQIGLWQRAGCPPRVGGGAF